MDAECKRCGRIAPLIYGNGVPFVFCWKYCKNCWNKTIHNFYRQCPTCKSFYWAFGEKDKWPECHTCRVHNSEYEKTRIKWQLYRTKKRYNAPATLTVDEWMKTLADFDYSCAYCGKKPFTVLEHYIPLDYLGRYGTTKDNCVPACAGCNTLKAHMEYRSDDFLENMERVGRYLHAKKG